MFERPEIVNQLNIVAMQMSRSTVQPLVIRRGKIYSYPVTMIRRGRIYSCL